MGGNPQFEFGGFESTKMKRLCRGHGDGDGGAGAGGSINEILPEELLENILWRIKKASEAAACGMVCRLWVRIIRKCPALELHFDLINDWEGFWIPRTEAIIGGMLMHRPQLRVLSIIVKQRPKHSLPLSEDRIINWFLPLASAVETLQIRIQGLNLTKCLKMPRLKKLLVSHSVLRKMPLPLRARAGKNLRFCSLDSVAFYAPINELLSACPCLEGLILSHCRVPSCRATAISSTSLRRLFVVNSNWSWIFLDAPELEIVCIKSFIADDLIVSGSRRTRIECLMLVSPIRLQCRVRAVYVAGDDWGLPTLELPPVPALKHPLGVQMSDEAVEEMKAWLEKFGEDHRHFGSRMRVIEAHPTRGWRSLERIVSSSAHEGD